MNPFKHGQIVTGTDFCGRREELKLLRDRINSGQNVVLYGERRCGKSSLIAEAVRTTKGYRPVFVDFMNVKSVDGACRRIAAGIFKMEKAESIMRRLGRTLAALRPTLTIDPLTGSPTLGFDASVTLDADSVAGALSLLGDLSASRKLVVVFDEFQGVLNIPERDELLALMRAEIQRQGGLCYLFAGSVRNEMYSVFSDPASPFFKSATIMEVPSLPKDVYSRFLEKRFSGGKRSITRQAMDFIFSAVSNVSGDIQHLCEAVWDTTSEKDTIDVAQVQAGLQRIIAQYAGQYQTIISNLTAFQMRCMGTIARIGGEHINSNEFLSTGGFANASSIKAAVTRLCKLNILFERDNAYRFVSPFFRIWVREQPF